MLATFIYYLTVLRSIMRFQAPHPNSLWLSFFLLQQRELKRQQCDTWYTCVKKSLELKFSTSMIFENSWNFEYHSYNFFHKMQWSINEKLKSTTCRYLASVTIYMKLRGEKQSLGGTWIMIQWVNGSKYHWYHVVPKWVVLRLSAFMDEQEVLFACFFK